MIALTAFTLAAKNDNLFLKEIARYFTCELPGNDPQNSCDRSRYQALLYPEMNCISYVLLGMFPVVNLVFAVNIKELKERCACACLFRHILTSSKSRSNSTTSTVVANQRTV